ncbi:hypothetical protein, partial [Escherichia coli]
MLDDRTKLSRAEPSDVVPTVFAPIAPTPALRDDEPYSREELLHEIFDATSFRHGARCALRFLGDDPDSSRRTELSYAELYERSLRFARQLRSMGVS